MIVHRLLATLLLVSSATAHAAQSCGSRLFVSGWNSTVHVFDACTGQYLRDLDTRTRLPGAMAVRLGPDGFIYAVSEQGNAIHKYRNDTLEYAGAFAQVGAIGATGLAFDAAGVAFVGGFQSDDVRRFDRAGAALGPAFAARGGGLNGPDSGMTFGPDGNLYIPSWESNSVVRYDPRTGEAATVVASRTAGLLHTRGLLPARDGQNMFITSEGSGAVLKWNLGSGAVTVLATGLSGPTGIDYGPDGKLLVSNGDGVVRVDPETGAILSTFVPGGAGGIAAQVFLSVLSSVDTTQVNTQFWVVGDAVLNGRVLDIPFVYTAGGAQFGPLLRRADITVKRWGRVRIELTSCTEATFSWDSTGADSAGFGTGSYPVTRFFENEATVRCRAQGVDNADKSWVSGQWWGGEGRSGEGLFLDSRADGTTFFAWFTHRPR
jgi:WD40 repeat protein